MTYQLSETYNRSQISLIEEDFVCEGQNVKLTLKKDAICIQAFPLVIVIKYTFDMEFQVIYEEMTPIGLRIYTKLQKLSQETMELQNCQSQEIELFFYKRPCWTRHLQWQKIFITKCRQKWFSHNFEIIKKIGEGNFSIVYHAKNLFTHTIYAVKKIIKYRTQSQKDKTTLYNQIKLLRLLNHQNISKFYGVYEEDKILYLVLQNVEGTSLEQFISQKKKQHSKLLREDVAIILRQILKAVKYMAANGVLHRDLKPENILITLKKEIKIIDFNLATLVNEPKYLFVRCGTVGYVAPQILKIKDDQFSSCRLQTISDMFSVGAIFYKLLFLENLFLGLNSQIVKKNFKYTGGISDQDKNKVTSQEFDLLTRMLDPNPKTRITPSQALNHNYFEKYFGRKSAAEKENYNQNQPKPCNKNGKQNIRRSFSKKTFAQTITDLGKSLFD